MKTLLMLLATISGDFDRGAIVYTMHDGKFCSGVHVGDGVIISAEHCSCSCGGEVDVIFTVQGKKRKFKATSLYDPPKNNTDEAYLLKIANAPDDLPVLKIATKFPKVGDKVTGLGWPGGTWAQLEGEILTVEPTRVTANFRTLGGHSGGALLNQDNELIGIASTRTLLPSEIGDIPSGPNVIIETHPASGWINLQSIHTAMENVHTQEAKTQKPKATDPTVIVFTTPDCPACERFKRDVIAGHFSRFKIEYVTYRAGVWDKPHLYQEWHKAVKPNPDKTLSFPLIWVRGSDTFQSGYEPSRRGGLISAILLAFDRLVISPILGEKRPADFPQPPGPPEDDEQVEELEASPKDVPPVPLPEDSKLIQEIEKLRQDIDNIKNGNVFEKVGALKSIRGDLENLKSDWKYDLRQHGEQSSKEFTNKLDLVLTDVDKIKNGNLFEKAGALKNVRKHASDLVAEAKTDLQKSIPGKDEFDPLALLGLVGGVLAWYKRKHEDSIVDGETE